ncbi:MAG: M23 family metallopeptidase [Oscillospiraceae bacterium]|nr:M23 family metallopeptidase [Oscillospiraceae bacterium]
MAQVTEAIAFLNESKSEIEANKSEVSASRNTLKEKQAELDGQIAELQGAISKLDGAIAQENKHVKEIEGDLADISEQIKNLSGRNNAIFEREFKWPVPGYYSLSSPYGYRVNPVSGVYKLHAGIDISGGAIYGKPVVAAADGIVIKASDTGDGYGKCVMIDHGLNNGNRYVTLYGHNSAFNVSNGQTVKAGQTIAYIGSTGNSTGPHCHFEIRVNSSPVDPMQYFRK